MTLASSILVACTLVAAASILGGAVPALFKTSHRSMQVMLSVVAGAMAGIAVLDLIPHALEAISSGIESSCDHDHHGHSHGAGHGHDHATEGAMRTVMVWVAGGFLAMYLLERFVCFHHHESDTSTCEHQAHSWSWGGAFIGLSVHAILAGLGLGAAIVLESGQSMAWPGLAMLIAIVMHKPFDGLAIVGLLRRDGHGGLRLWAANIGYALVTPAGILIAWASTGGQVSPQWAGPAVAATAGILLCIALADLLPELQQHAHDRLLLTISMLVGLGLAGAAAFLH